MDRGGYILLVVLAVFMISGGETAGELSCTHLQATYDWKSFISPNNPPNYDNDISICWIIAIYASSQYRVRLRFSTFDIEPSNNCTNDYLDTRDGNSTYSPLIGRFCGSDYVPDVVSTRDQIYVYFHKENNSTTTGFTIQYKFVGGHPNRVTTYDMWNWFTSPNYPSNYANDLSMTWIIKPYWTGDRVQIRSPNFDIEPSDNCTYDYLEIRDGVSGYSPLIGRFCGSGSVPEVTSSGREMYIYFHTDRNGTDGGFLIQHRYIVDDDSSIHAKDCTLLTAYSSRRTFTSPNYPGRYDQGLDICWIITAYYWDERVRLRFLDFDVISSNYCTRDYLDIRDGKTNDSPLIHTYCGSENIPDVTSTGDVIFVHFHSHVGATKRGFNIEYTFPVAGDSDDGSDTGNELACTSLTAFSYWNYFSSPSYEYDHGLSICWIITADFIGDLVLLSFLEVPLLESSYRCDFTYLHIRDGNNSYAPLLKQYCGSSGSGNDLHLTSTGDHMYVYLHTDRFSSMPGFRARYKYVGGGTPCTELSASSSWKTLATPNYPYSYANDLAICWIITPEYFPDKVFLQFSHFDVTYSNKCSQDYLELRAGSSNDAPLFQRYCGSFHPPDITIDGIYLYFRTGSGHTRSGFSLQYRHISQHIDTPDQPVEGAATSDMSSVWIVIAAVAGTIGVVLVAVFCTRTRRNKPRNQAPDGVTMATIGEPDSIGPLPASVPQPPPSYDPTPLDCGPPPTYEQAMASNA